ncbi:hypothetical protein [Pseudomonas faucium]|uniref:hypothetical protein n=1 Tax=Pseudomonas faucium TaxID=2740518 RepID=UPI001596AB21|nr:hypothetical protein [Pseudomonas faucium]
MANDVIVAVQFDDNGRPLNFELASYSGYGSSPIEGGNRFELASWIAEKVLAGAKFDTLINAGSGGALAGYLTVVQGDSGEPVFGIDDRSGAGRTLNDLRRIR